MLHIHHCKYAIFMFSVSYSLVNIRSQGVGYLTPSAGTSGVSPTTPPTHAEAREAEAEESLHNRDVYIYIYNCRNENIYIHIYIEYNTRNGYKYTQTIQNKYMCLVTIEPFLYCVLIIMFIIPC